MRLGIVGSRDWPDREFVFQKISEFLRHHPDFDTLVSGGQPKGVDGWVPEISSCHEKELIEYLPAHFYPKGHAKYRAYAPQNFFERNTQIAHGSDVLIAFCVKGSKGTMDTVTKARARGIDVIVYTERDLGQ